jgi:hypothetical protein
MRTIQSEMPMPFPAPTPRCRAVAAAALLALVLPSCDNAVAPGTVEPIGETALRRHLDVLADDSLYGRAAGWLDELRAAEYVRDQFIAVGLSPGVDGYLQTFWIGEQPPPATPPDAGIGSGDHDGPRGTPADDPIRPERFWSQNVLGVLPGRGRLARQWVVLGAHYDHIGWTVPLPDSVVVYNGADDNASGTAMLVELARYLSALLTTSELQSGDRRSIMFHAYGAEEIGLVGSRHFCAHPTVPMDSVVAMVNLDMVGRLRDGVVTAVGTSTAPSLWQQLLEAANEDGLEFNLQDKGSSDHRCFAEAGRPVLHLFTGLHQEYHTPLDDVWLLNVPGMVQVGNLAAGVLVELVTRPDLSSVGN